MLHSNPEVGLPRIPTFQPEARRVEPPKGKTRTAGGAISFEHSWELVLFLVGKGIRNLPRIVKSVLLPLAAVTIINIILESIPTYSVQGAAKILLFFFVFITASYNSIIPRTIFWVVIFTAGKTLFRRMRTEGFWKVLADFGALPSGLLEARRSLGRLSGYILLVSGGLGFIAANFLTRNNRLDKALVTYVIAITLINALSKGKQGILFTALKLFYKDLAGFMKRSGILTDSQAFIAVSGFTLGLLANSIFGIVKLDYGGYLLGSVLFTAGMLLILLGRKRDDEKLS
ncbi:hypothetical protein [Petroclostridium xylanilyticum]|uniref:hypothetical protein n=1 Tax=Petroclostridium xylanilyticum TaxID=1792311 RepID=UPI000B988BBC|nr:hypothetical protein [Petroclostridium xylanilyticum]